MSRCIGVLHYSTPFLASTVQLVYATRTTNCKTASTLHMYAFPQSAQGSIISIRYVVEKITTLSGNTNFFL